MIEFIRSAWTAERITLMPAAWNTESNAEVIRTYHTADGPLDVARFVIRADMAVFDYRFPVPD
jgi:hypothetical protein